MAGIKHQENNVIVEIDNVDLARNVLSIAFSGNHKINIKCGTKLINHHNNLEIRELYDDCFSFYYTGISNVYSIKYEHIREITILDKQFLNE